MTTIIDLEPIIEAVRKKFLQPKDFLKGTSKYKFSKMPRQVAYYLAHKKFGHKNAHKGYSYVIEMEYLTGRNPTTILRGVKRLKVEMAKSPLLTKQVNELQKELNIC